MSNDSKIEPAAATVSPETAQADIIRSAMSLNNILIKPTATLDVSEAQSLSPPSVSSESMREEISSPVASSDIMMKEASELDGVSDQVANGPNVPDSQREFVCVNDEHTRCQTGQYTKDLSRKVISDHFGRNKACTRYITEWPLFCRKHYQRATYNKTTWQIRKVQLILRQFDIIEDEFPGTTYDVTLKKSEEARLNQYSRQVASGQTNDAAEKSVTPVSGKHFEAPIEVLRELDQWLGRGKSYDEVKDIVDVISQMLESKECEQVPAIEFLPQLPGKTVSPKKSPKSPWRVSNHGSVKKTNQKA